MLPLPMDRAGRNLGIEYTRETTQDMHLHRRKERLACRTKMSINVLRESDGKI